MSEVFGYTDILKELLAQVPDTLDKREGSVIYTVLAPAALLLARQNYMLSSLFDLLFADTANGTWLDRITYDFGIQREQATCARRKIIFTDTQGQPFEPPAGSRFALGDCTFSLGDKLDAGTYAALCEQAGTVGNLYSGSLLPVDNINGLGSALLEPLPIIAARDEETDDELRERFYRQVRQSPYGGNIADYTEKTLSIDGVGAVQVFAAPVMGGGNVGLVIGDEQGNRASTELVEAVQKAMGVNGDGIAPIWHTVSVTTSTDMPIDVTVTLWLKSGTSLEIVRSEAEKAIRDYIENIAFNEPTIFYAKLVAAILNSHNSILDVESMTMNNALGNIQLIKTFENFQVPTIGTIQVKEVEK